MKILFLQKRLLFPHDTGLRIRTLNVVRYLARWHDVTYLCNVQSAEEPYLEPMRKLGLRLETVPWRETRRASARFYCDLLRNLVSSYPFTAQKNFDPALKARAAALLAEQDYDLLICDTVMMARNCIGLGRLPRVLFQHNVESQILARHASDGPHWLRRGYMALQCRKMRRFEAWAGRQFDAIVAVSGHDRNFFEQQYGWRHVQAIDTAVDIEYFQPSPAPAAPDRVVFLGSMDWLPNQDGVMHFVRHVWPRVMAERPRASFQVVGRNPPPAVLRLAQQPGVEVVGTVLDVRPYLAGASVVVVPLLVGGGTRIKIFEALSMEKAVVSTSLGAEGLPVEPGRHLLVADDPAGFARSVLTLLDEPHQAARLGQAGRELVRQSYCAEKIARQFEAICLEAAGLVHDVGPSVAAVAVDQAARLEEGHLRSGVRLVGGRAAPLEQSQVRSDPARLSSPKSIHGVRLVGDRAAPLEQSQEGSLL